MSIPERLAHMERMSTIARLWIEILSTAREVRILDGCGSWRRWERTDVDEDGPRFVFFYVRAI